MLKRLLVFLIVLVSLSGFASTSYSIPNIWGVWTWEITESAHILVSPSGSGTALSDANLFMGGQIDATIRVQLWVDAGDGGSGDPPAPVANYPAEDLWLEILYLNMCGGGTVADGPTDSEGWFTFSRPLSMGGSNDPAAGPPVVIVMVSGMILYDENRNHISPSIVANSPDINADLVVNLTDVAIFAADFHGDYNYESDFLWDGVINLSDVVFMAAFMGDQCP